MSEQLNFWQKIIGKITRAQVNIASYWQVKEGGDNSPHLATAASNDSVSAKSKHERIFWLIILSGFCLLVAYRYLQVNRQTNKIEQERHNSPMNIQVASSALDAEKMWRNHFEDKLVDNSEKVTEKLKLIETSINQQTSDTQQQIKSEMDNLKTQMQYLAAELGSSRRELGEVKSANLRRDQEVGETGNSKSRYDLISEANINVNHLDRAEKFDHPKSSRNYIPETSYVTGVLLGGIAVSTAMGSSSEPVPVVIRITDRGNLPKNFNIDLTHCQIMGSSYGDLSSERAIVRAEILSCKDPVNELIYTTKLAGIIFGDDGMNGIKGKVVQTSGKHLKNAMIGGMISGLASSSKGQDAFSITSLGTVGNKRKGAGEITKDGLLNGASSAAEKLADYYIKQAESMSPVLLVSGGTKVNVLFTKGVYLGALDVQEKLEILRNDKVKK
jgi:hypothetical protein